MSEKYLKAIVDLKKLSEKTEFKRYLPSDSIKDIVELFWHVSWDLKDNEYINQKILPNPHVNIVHYIDGTYVEGVVKEYFNYRLTKKGSILGVKFKVGGFKSLYPGEISNLTNKKIIIEDIIKADFSCLNKLTIIEEKIIKIEEILTSFKYEISDKQKLAKEIVNYIKDNQSIHKMKEICDHFQLNERLIQRLFKQYVGVNVKWVIRVYRLQELKEIVENNDRVNWAEIAYELDYSDQSHMINDFKAVVGMTPKTFQLNKNN